MRERGKQKKNRYDKTKSQIKGNPKMDTGRWRSAAVRMRILRRNLVMRGHQHRL